MANTIKLKRGTGSDPSASDLVLGEIAIRTDTGKLFTKKDNGTVAEISGSGGGGSDIFINTLSSSSGSGGGSASFNGSATRFTLSNPPDVSAQQLLVSINGVIQKPNSGTSPSEGFALDGTDIIFAAAPATGADFFIITYGSIGVSVPADNSVTSAKIVDGTIVGTDLATNVDLVDDQKIRFGTGNDLQIYHTGSNSNSNIRHINSAGSFYIDSANSTYFRHYIDSGGTISFENFAVFNDDGTVDLYYDNSKKFATNSQGVSIYQRLVCEGTAPSILFSDTNHQTYTLTADANVFKVTDANNGDRLQFNGNGTISAFGFFNCNNAVYGATGLSTNGNITINDDNDKLRIGASQDLEIFHDGSNSYLQNSTGNLILKNANADYIKGINSTGAVELYYNASKKLETTSIGIDVSGEINVGGNNSRFAENNLRFFSAGNAFIDHGTVGQDIVFRTSQNSAVDTTALTIDASDAGTAIFNHDVKIPDNGKLLLGNSGDIDIFHDGTNGIIANNTGVFYLKTINGEFTLVGRPNAQTELYYDHSKKFETISSGIKILGDASTGSIIQGDLRLKAADSGTTLVHWNPENNEIRWDDDYKASFGDSADLKIYHNGSHSYIEDSGTGTLRIQSSQMNVLKADGSETMATFVADAEVALFYNNSKKFETTSTGVKVSGTNLNMNSTYIDFSGSISTPSTAAAIYRPADNTLAISTANTEKLRIDQNGTRFYGNLYGDDNREIRLGNSGDLQIYHDGSNSYVNDQGTGSLRLVTNELRLMNASNNELMIYALQNSYCQLRFDNSTKLQTTSGGVDITGTMMADGIQLQDNHKINFGNSQDLQIYHNGTSSFIDNHNSGHIYIRNNDGSDFGGNIYIQAKSGENSISIIHDGSVQLFYDNDRVFYTETRGVRLADNTKIYENSSHNTAVIQHADIHHAIILRGATNNNGSTITNENTTTFREYGQMQFRTGGNGNMPVRLTIASNGVVSGNLNDTSDAKFKENIVSIADGAISKIKQLRPVNFDWKKEMQVEDAKGESGFIAQEVLTVIPDLVKGIEYNDDEKTSGYSVNTTGLVAYLTKALQEVIARLETLEGG